MLTRRCRWRCTTTCRSTRTPHWPPSRPSWSRPPCCWRFSCSVPSASRGSPRWSGGHRDSRSFQEKPMPDHRSRLRTIPVHTLANGHQLVLHVHEMESGRPGPTLGVIATIHGDEPLSIEIVRRLLQEVDLSRLRGRIRALPVANPYAYQSSTRNLPLDMSNLNRIF